MTEVNTTIENIMTKEQATEVCSILSEVEHALEMMEEARNKGADGCYIYVLDSLTTYLSDKRYECNKITNPELFD